MKHHSTAAVVLSVLLAACPLGAQVQGQWASAGTMQSGRQSHALVPLKGGNALAAGGVDSSKTVLATAEVYGSGAWTPTHSMVHARQLFPAVVLENGKVLVSGGLGVGNTVLGSAELYDPKSGQWTSAGFLHVARFGHSATLLGSGRVLVSGGCIASHCSTLTAVSEVYDPVANSWSTTGSLNTARYSHTAVLLKTGKVLAIGGSAGTSCELYNAAKGTWSAAASMKVSRASNATTLLQSGKVLVSGGAIGRYPIKSAKIYDPTANTWTLTGNMTAARYAHTATLLTDGTVLVAGGEGQSISCGKACTTYIPFAKVDIYNEAAGTFTAAAGLARALAYHSTTLLESGRALTAGGTGTTYYCCVVVNNAEVYTPLTLTFSSTSLNFGLLQIGLTSPAQTVTVTNVSSHSVTFASISASRDYSKSSTCPISPATLNAGRNCTLNVTFTPTAAGFRSGAVTLKDNSPGSPIQTISLTGTGETLTLGFTPASINFGNVVVTSTGTQSATLTNDGAASVKITGIAIFPADGTYTQTNHCLGATLAVQQTCTFQITFTPPDVFTYNATLSVTNSRGPAATLPLTGTGLDGP